MATWIMLTIGSAVLLVVWRLRRPEDEKLEPPSNMTMFFHPVKGEGDLFLGGMLIIYFFSRLALFMFQDIRSVFFN